MPRCPDSSSGAPPPGVSGAGVSWSPGSASSSVSASKYLLVVSEDDHVKLAVEEVRDREEHRLRDTL
jgi:hypothetical protein